MNANMNLNKMRKVWWPTYISSVANLWAVAHRLRNITKGRMTTYFKNFPSNHEIVLQAIAENCIVFVSLIDPSIGNHWFRHE